LTVYFFGLFDIIHLTTADMESMMKTTKENIFMVIEKTASGKKIVSWQQIVEAVKESGMVIKNWMTVRNVLQWFINDRVLIRTSDLYVEEYEVRI